MIPTKSENITINSERFHVTNSPDFNYKKNLMGDFLKRHLKISA